jgi:hypothetical protein
MSYIILRGCWCHIIVLNVHAATEDKTDDVKDSFYKELECVFDKFLKYHMKIGIEIGVCISLPHAVIRFMQSVQSTLHTC